MDGMGERVSGLVEVRIRSVDEADGRRLTIWPIDGLERLIAEMSAWGVRSGDVTQTVVGQFVIDRKNGPHFEPIVGEDEV
jgi:hypothetical protein